jgi:hypothetical protein
MFNPKSAEVQKNLLVVSLCRTYVSKTSTMIICSAVFDLSAILLPNLAWNLHYPIPSTITHPITFALASALSTHYIASEPLEFTYIPTIMTNLAHNLYTNLLPCQPVAGFLILLLIF